MITFKIAVCTVFRNVADENLKKPFINLGKLLLKFIWKNKSPKIAETFKKKK